VITCSFGAFVGGKDLHTSLCVGMGLAQIGEFSFIIATLGVTLNVTSSFLYPIAVAVSVVTTLATPYLMRGTSSFVGFLERVLPRPLMQSLEVYTAWVGSFGKVAPSPTTLLVRQMGWQLLINLLLTVGIFAFWAWVGDLPTDDWPKWFQSDAMQDIVCWLGAVIFTAPIYLASARKIQAMSSLIAEIFVPRTTSGHRLAARSLVGQLFILISFTVMTFLTVLLSTSILGSFTAMLPLLLLVTVVALLCRRLLVRIYSRAEMALNETLLELPAFHEAKPKVLPEILHEAELETLEIPAGSQFADQTLRDIPLRGQTGTSIVAIERGGQRMINPGPEEVLLPGDRVLLLGQAEQLTGARALLSGIK
jgi:CPA2 family monovalent cation:H+ antiporter-2